LNRLLSRLRRNNDGAVMIEFALIGPVLLTMLFGVLQIGLGMQNYNAMRSISADVARFAVVSRQAGTTVTTTSLKARADQIASAAPYGLMANRFTSTVSVAGTQRVTGATEYTIQLQYDVPTFLGFVGVDEIPLTFSRPIFVVS
jgi:Flp pilus assembly protein TadG